MAIVSINYNKVHAEKKSQQFSGQISIKNNVSITNISIGNIQSSDKQKALVVDFAFSIVYEPIGIITIEGSVIDIEDETKAKDCIELWDKEKKVDKELTTRVISVVLEKCSIKAIMLSQDIGLPSPVPLPRIKVNQDDIQVKSLLKEKKEDNKENKDKKKK
jgi:hypothetical protein